MRSNSPRKRSFALAAVAALLALSPAVRASDVVNPGGGTLAQVVDGGGTYTIITLVNLDNVTIPYKIFFFADSGSALTLNTSAGTNSVFSGTLPVGGSTIIRTNGTDPGISQGYAVVTSASNGCYGYGQGDGNCQIGGNAVFGITLNGQTLETTTPLDTGAASVFAIPFDSTTSNTGVAITNSVGDNAIQFAAAQAANLTFKFFDQSGVNFYTSTMQLANGQHTAFLLASQFPQIAGQTGVMVIGAADASKNPYYIKALGLRLNLAGTTYTSIAPLVPCYWYPNRGCQQY